MSMASKTNTRERDGKLNEEKSRYVQRREKRDAMVCGTVVCQKCTNKLTFLWCGRFDVEGQGLHGPPKLLLQSQHVLCFLTHNQGHRLVLHGLPKVKRVTIISVQ